MGNTVSISAQIPEELGQLPDQVARDEERSKSCCVKKSPEVFLRQRQRTVQPEKNTAVSLEQIKNGEYSEMNGEFRKRVKKKAGQKVSDSKKSG